MNTNNNKIGLNITEAVEQFTNDNDITVSFGNFREFGDFISYFRTHYAPMLKRVQAGESFADQPQHLVGFFIDDILEAFGEQNQSKHK